MKTCHDTTPAARWAPVPLLAILALAGCEHDLGRGPAASASSSEMPAAAAAEDVPHSEFANWSRFPVGTAVVREKHVENGTDAVQVTTTLTLVEKSSARVVVESQITIARRGHEPQTNPPLRFDFPATFRLPGGMTSDQFSLPALKARLEDDEPRQACGREFSTQRFAWNEVNENGPMTVTLWRCDEIPGRLLRQEITGNDHISREEVTTLTVPTAAAP
jgi:hypothetical protein